MLVANTKQDCRDSSSPRAQPLIAIGRLLLEASRSHGGPVAALVDEQACRRGGRVLVGGSASGANLQEAAGRVRAGKFTSLSRCTSDA
jgi:hypothetical protein